MAAMRTLPPSELLDVEPEPVGRRPGPRHGTLDGVLEAVSQTEGIGLTELDAFTTLAVRTEPYRERRRASDVS